MPATSGHSTGDASVSPRAQDLQALLGNLSSRVIDTATGATLPYGTRLSDDPQSKLWLGMLASEPQLTADAIRGNTFSSKLVPAAQGFSFRVPSLPAILTLTVSASVFVPLTPNFDEQRASITDSAGDDGSTPLNVTPAGPGTGPGGPAAVGQGSGQGFPIAAVWTKVRIEPVTVEVTITEGGRVRIGEEELAAAFTAAAKPPTGSERLRPRRRTSPVGSLPRDADVLDNVTWDRYVVDNLIDIDDLTPPTHRAAIDLEVRSEPDPVDGVEVLAVVVNTSPAADTQLFDGTNPYDTGAVDARLYEVVLSAATHEPLIPYQLEQVAKSYRYDRSVTAFGQGCPVATTTTTGDGTGPGLTILRTEFAATQQTSRVHPRLTLELPGADPVPIETDFVDFIADPVGALDRLVAAQRAWVEHSWSSAELDRIGASLGWNISARAEADGDAVTARTEVGWVAAGVDLIRTNSAVRDAFVLANKTMLAVAASSPDPYTAWRPFQVAWLVGCLPGMADPDAHPDVDIVWFATGGGKSEAYLGLMATTLFYGRLTGTTAGTQVWARFPLRLLALQQNERFAAVICQAELLRRDHDQTSHGDPFGLGFFVGSGNTPNKLQATTSPYYRGMDPFDPGTAERCRVLEGCPVCGTRLDVAFDGDAWTMQHICRQAGCPIAGVLPVWSIDDDIYRNAPSVLVGTVDKLAQLAHAKHFSILLGRAQTRCPVHGYTADPTYCGVFGCNTTRQPVPTGFGAVRLEIADELHLLEESLGALDGMYETLLQAISTNLGNPTIQVVGATATIEGYDSQVKHLYQREAHRFPVNGPTVTETFWSTSTDDDPLRSYLGLRPRGITMVTATREIAVAHNAWLTELSTRPDQVLTAASGLDPDDPVAQAAANAAWSDLYEVLVAYGLRNEDLNSFMRDSDIQDLLSANANLATINGDADPAHIRDAVRRLTDPPTAQDERVKVIAATRAIGHGFDVSRLGVMAIMGTPTQAAEVIQASARVGRRWPGLVVNVINPSRDRDASVYRYYADWIRYLDRLVHKVPVNRESLPVLNRVLSGGLMAWLMQVHDVTWLTSGQRRKSLTTSVGFAAAVNSGFIDKPLLVDDLTKGFGIDPSSVYHQMHRDAIKTWVDQQLAMLPLRADGSTRLNELLIPNVPTSLRDVEDPIVIYGNV